MSRRRLGNFILGVVRSSPFFSDNAYHTIFESHFFKNQDFSFSGPLSTSKTVTWWSTRLGHISRTIIFYMFYAQFFMWNQLRLVPDMAESSRTVNDVDNGNLVVPPKRVDWMPVVHLHIREWDKKGKSQILGRSEEERLWSSSLTVIRGWSLTLTKFPTPV